MEVTVMGYGSFEGRVRQGVMKEYTRKTIHLELNGIKERYRTKDGKRENDNFWSGWKLTPESMKKIREAQTTGGVR